MLFKGFNVPEKKINPCSSFHKIENWKGSKQPQKAQKHQKLQFPLNEQIVVSNQTEQ